MKLIFSIVNNNESLFTIYKKDIFFKTQIDIYSFT